jgi:peptide/nickel transport system permease protein
MSSSLPADKTTSRLEVNVPEHLALRWLGLATVFILLALRVAASFIDAVPPVGFNPAASDLVPMEGPSATHLLGTDQLGRDLLVRLVVSVEAFFAPGIFAAVLALLLSIPAGALLGYRSQGPLTAAVRFGLTTLAAWPRLVLVVVVVSAFTAIASDPAAWEAQRLFVLGALVGISFVPDLAGSLAERTRSLREEKFIEACRAHGIAERDILLRHILWANCRHLLLRQVCLVFGAFILVETSLSYLGDYGVPPPRPSWGNMLAGVKSSVLRSKSLISQSSPESAGLIEGLSAAVSEGGLLAIICPSLAILVSIGGILSLAEYLARRDEQ